MAQDTSPKPGKGNRRDRRRLIGRVVWTLVVLLLLVGLVRAFAPKPIPVSTARVTRGPLQVTVDEDGFTRVRDRYSVTSPQAGDLERITLRAGDRVERGDVVARLTAPASNLLDPRSREEAEARLATAQAAFRQAQASVGSARAAHALSEQELQRQQSLSQQGATTDREFDQARFQERQLRAELDSARFAVEVAREQVAQAQAVLVRVGSGKSAAGPSEAIEVRAPVSGTVLIVHRESGGVVTMGEALLDVGNLAALEVVVDVLTTQAVGIEPGDRVFLVRWGGGRPGEVSNGDDPAATLSGRVRRVEPGAFTKKSALGVDEQRVNVIIDLAADATNRPALGDGFRVEARIVVWEDDDVVQVPPGAVHRIDGEWGAYVVEEERARLRKVKLGPRGEAGYAIRDGLKPGEVVVLYPSDDVEDGVSVRQR